MARFDKPPRHQHTANIGEFEAFARVLLDKDKGLAARVTDMSLSSGGS
jgi:hypothetical protein